MTKMNLERIKTEIYDQLYYQCSYQMRENVDSKVRCDVEIALKNIKLTLLKMYVEYATAEAIK